MFSQYTSTKIFICFVKVDPEFLGLILRTCLGCILKQEATVLPHQLKVENGRANGVLKGGNILR